MKLSANHWNHVRKLAVLLIAILWISGCSFPPKPTNEQIWEAVQRSNQSQAMPLELQFEEMEVPQRSSGQAAAVLWTPDHKLQRNYRVRFEKGSGTFEVKSFITLELDESGAYREIEGSENP